MGTGITPASAELPSLTFTHQMGLVLTANFIANPFTPAIIGKFNGLILPDTQLPAPNGTATSNDTVGFLTATVTSTGSFSGQVKMAAQVFSISGVFDNTGLARFGTTRTTSLTLVPTSGLPWLEVVLHLDLTGTTSKITGTVTRKERSVITAVSNIDADRAFYSTTNKVSSALAGTTSKSYTLVFKHRSSQSGLTATEYPQGDGYATGTVKTDGTVSFTGMLADNTAVTLSAPLSKNDQWPLFTQLYSLKGAVVGMVKVQSASTTDMDSSAGLLWLRPYQSVQWYPFGWPDSIGLDLIGSIYNGPPASVYPGLAAVDAMNGNAKLTFYAGKLTASQIKFVNLSPTNALTRAPTNDTTFTATIVPASGLLKGTFNHTDTTKPAWQGVLFPKAGANQGGYGYFMTASPEVIDGTGESGAVHFESK